MSELRLADVVAALVATRDRLQDKVGHANVAIEALGKLLSDDSPPPPAGLPAPPRPPRNTALKISAASEKAAAREKAAADRRGHKVYGAGRPRTSVCRNARCSKVFAVKPSGRVPHYCSDVCRTAVGKRLRAAIATKVAPAATPDRRRMPRADRPVEDAELDSLLTGGREEAPAAEQVENLVSAPEPIAESSGGMKARIAKLAAGDVAPRSRFLEGARLRNDEAARRSTGNAR